MQFHFERAFTHSFFVYLCTMSRIVNILLLLFLVSGCADRQPATTPRPVAYPRVQLADTAFCDVQSAAKLLRIQANSQARQLTSRRNDDAVWTDIVYDIYDSATLHLTVQSLPAAKLPEAMKNRMQRIELNVGSARTQVTELDNGRFEGIVVKAYGADVTPLQLLATDNKSLLVYGSFEMPAANDQEMTRPIVNAVEKDMIRMVNNLDYPE